MWNHEEDNRAEWLEKQQQFLKDWDEFIEVSPQGSFEGSSNLHIPMPLWVLKAYHARFMQAILGPELSLEVKANNSAYADKSFNIEKLMEYALLNWANHNKGVEDVVDQWIWNWLAVGVSYVKWRWDKVFKFYEDVEERYIEGLPKFGVHPFTKEEVLIPTQDVIQEEKEIIRKIYDGPVLEFIPFEDIIVVGTDILDTDRADVVMHRQYLTADELWTLADRGILDKDAVEKIIQSGEDYQGYNTSDNIKQQRSIGAYEPGMTNQSKLSRYEIIEAYLKYDVKGNGINSDIIVWVAKKTNTVLRATYTHRLNSTGECPVAGISFHKRSGMNKNNPIGLAEMLHPLSLELDAIHNIRIDSGLLTTVPFGFYRAGSSVDPKKIKVEPGTLYPLNDPTGDIYFPNLGNRSVFGLNEESGIYHMVERLTGLSDPALGVIGSSQGITRTATGVSHLSQEMNVNLDVPLKRLNRGWKKVLKTLMHTLQKKIPSGLEFRITSDTGISNYITLNGPNDIAGDYDFEVAPSTAASNKGILLSQASQILQLVQNPLFIQTGIITPSNIYEALKNYLKLLGIKSFSKFINSGFENQTILTPKEEFDRVMAGDAVPILPQGDHQGFINYADSVLSDTSKLGMYQESQAIMLKAHRDAHAEMLNALNQMAAQQANMQQLNINTQMGEPQIPQGEVRGGGLTTGGLPE